jgi:hypothetical protein
MSRTLQGSGSTIATLGTASGAWTTASAQQDPEQTKALFTLLIDNQRRIPDDMVIGQVMPVGGPVSDSRGVILRVRDSQVVE